MKKPILLLPLLPLIVSALLVLVLLVFVPRTSDSTLWHGLLDAIQDVSRAVAQGWKEAR